MEGEGGGEGEVGCEVVMMEIMGEERRGRGGAEELKTGEGGEGGAEEGEGEGQVHGVRLEHAA